MKSVKLIVGACALALSGTAMAGFQTVQAVVIATSSRFADGDLSYVRSTRDSTQYIGCNVWYSGVSAMVCFALASNGTYGSCYTESPALIAVGAALQSDGSLYFAWDNTATCVFVESTTGSFTAPKK